MKRTLALIATILALVGCSTTERTYSDLGASALRNGAAQSHYLLTPEMAALIGAAPFTGQFELSYGPITRLRGGIAGRDGKLMFTPEDTGSKEDGSTATWMVWNNGGFVMSDALQGYASTGPSTNNLKLPTDVTRDPRFPVPTRIAMTNQGNLIALTISRITGKAPPIEAFAVPSAFKQYPNPEAMAGELIRRRTDVVSAESKARRDRFGNSPTYDVDDLPSPRRP